MAQLVQFPLLAPFSALQDPRPAAKLLHPSPELLPSLLCATIAGADDFVELALRVSWFVPDATLQPWLVSSNHRPRRSATVSRRLIAKSAAATGNPPRSPTLP